MNEPIASGSLFDAPEPSVIGAALDWCLGLLSGSLVTVIATVAVAGLGFALLSGRAPVRRGVAIVMGIFLMTGAATAVEKWNNDGSQSQGGVEVSPKERPDFNAMGKPTGRPTSTFDPYAGASVPSG